MAGLPPAGHAVASARQVPDPGPPEAESAKPDLLFACIQDEAAVAVIDAGNLEVLRKIDLTGLGFSRTAKPHHVVAAPDGAHWYVSLIGENRVLRMDAEGRPVGVFETETPGMLALDAARGVLVATRSMSAVNPPSRVSLIDAETMEGDEVDVLFSRPHPVVLSTDGRWAYTGSLGENRIAAVSVEDGRVEVTDVEGPPHAFVQFALSPDGATLVAATELSGRLLAFDLSDPARPAPVASVEVGPMAFDPAFAPDGATVWVPVKGANEVAIVDVATWEVTERIRGPSLLQPHAIVFSADGRRAFVSNNARPDHAADPVAGPHAGHPSTDAAAGGARESAAAGAPTGNVTVVDVPGRRIVGVVELGANVTGLALRPGTAAP